MSSDGKPDEAHACERKMDPTRCWCPFSQDILDPSSHEASSDRQANISAAAPGIAEGDAWACIRLNEI